MAKESGTSTTRREAHVLEIVVLVVALCAIAVALVKLSAASSGLHVDRIRVGETPVTVFRSDDFALAGGGPVVVLAHGFAGSQQLMQPFAATLARSGYTAVTFDLPGHGRNPAPLTGDITRVEGATRTLVASLAQVAAAARGWGTGPIAVLGHSMATDVIIRFAEEAPDVAATVAVSMFSPAVTAEAPRNLLVIVGDWEGTLKREALRAVSLTSAPEPARPGVTYGDPARGTGRRAAFSAGVEHVGVLYSPDSMREALAWLDATFGIVRDGPSYLDARGPFILLLLVGIVLLARPLIRLLPVVSRVPLGAGLGWRRLWLPVVVPAVVTPLLLRVLPTHFLPVLVADYLAVHFALYGALTFACLRYASRGVRAEGALGSWTPLLVAAMALTLYAVGALGAAMDRYVTSFVPTVGRVPLLFAMVAGTASFFLADEWTTRGPGAGRAAPLATKVAFLVSLLVAVALDVQRLFFLLIIVPVIVAFFLVYGAFGSWAYRRTGHPFVGAIASAVGFAWAIAVTFPLVSG
jgi:pimeloyl-ACP methyl ester carboxylesterase